MSRRTIIGYNTNQCTREPMPLDSFGTYLVDKEECSNPLVLPAKWGIKEIRVKNAGSELVGLHGATKVIIYQGEVGQPNIDLLEVTLADLNLGTNVSLIGTDSSPIGNVLHYDKDLMIRTNTGALVEGNIICVQFKICTQPGGAGGNEPTTIIANLSAPEAQCLSIQNGQTHCITGNELSGVTTLDWAAVSDPVENGFSSVRGRVAYDPVTYCAYEFVRDNGSDLLTIRHSNGRPFVVLDNIDLNAYIVKRDQNGIGQWVIRISDNGSSTNDLLIYRIAFDASNNELQIAGGYTGLLTFYQSDGSIASTLSAPSNPFGLYTARYSSTGLFLWAARLDGPAIYTAPTFGIEMNVNSVTGDVYFSTTWSLLNGQTIDIYDSSDTLIDTFTEASFLFPATPNVLVKYSSTGSVIWRIINETAGFAEAAESFVESAIHDTSESYYIYVQLSGSADYVIKNYDDSIVATLTIAANNNHLIVKYNSSGVYQWHTFVTYTPSNIGDSGHGNIVCDQKTHTIYQSTNYIQGGGGTTVDTLSFRQSDGTIVAPLALNKSRNAVVVAWNAGGYLKWRSAYGLNGTRSILNENTFVNAGVVNRVTGDLYFYLIVSINDINAADYLLNFEDAEGNGVISEPAYGGVTSYLVKYDHLGTPKMLLRTTDSTDLLNPDGNLAIRCGSKILYSVEYQTGSKIYNNLGQLMSQSSVVTDAGQKTIQIQDNQGYSTTVKNVLTDYPSLVYKTDVPVVLCFDDPNVPFSRVYMEPNGYFELKWNGLYFDVQKDHWVTFEYNLA